MYENVSNKRSLRSPGDTLAQHFYTDETIYEQEVAWLRQNMWLMVGHESQIPNCGDYLLYEFDKDSVIIIRDDAGQVRAHHNVCRHRGSRICVKPTGTVRVLTCPYHAWSYGLDGRLRAAPFTSDDFAKASYALISCHVRVRCGLIFLSFAEVPPDFEAYIGLLTRELEIQDVQHSKVAKRALFSARANWKLLVQNNLECYHCRPAHPTYCAAHPGNPLGRPEEYGIQSRYDRVRKALSGSPSETARQFEPIYTGHDSLYCQYLNRQFIGGDFVTESVGGAAVAPLMGQNTYEGVQTQALPSPLTSVVLNPDYAVIYSFTPRSVRHTDIEVIWLVKDTAIEGVDFEVDRVTAVWEPTLQEDRTLAENAQLGIDSTAYRPGPYTQSEMLVNEFDRWYLRRVADERHSARN